jgi:hypothetical protein
MEKGIGLDHLYSPCVIKMKLMTICSLPAKFQRWFVLIALGTNYILYSFWQAMAWLHAFIHGKENMNIISWIY